MSDFSIFESLTGSESEHKIAQKAAADKLAAAIYDVREQYGEHLFCAKSKDEFNDRVALCKDDMMKTVNAHLMPVTGVMRKVCKTMEQEWKRRIAADSTQPAAPGSPMADTTYNTDPGPLYGGPMAPEGVVDSATGMPPSGPTVPNMTDVGMADSIASGSVVANRRTANRPLHEIAKDIKLNWPKVNYAAQPYLDALHELDSVDDMYYQDPASHIVNYFLSNAGTWRGPEAKRIKDELKGLVSRRAQRLADKTGPVQDLDQTFHPSDDELIPEGDFHGYKDSVDQNGPEKVDRNFTPGGDSGKHARVANEMMGYPAGSGTPAPPPMPDASGMVSDPNTPAPPPGTAGSAATAAIVKRYAQWCVDNLARPSLKTMEYYAANRSDREYMILTAALQRHAEVPGGGASEGWGFGGWGTPVNPGGGGGAPEPQPIEIEPAMDGMMGGQAGGAFDLGKALSGYTGSRRTAAGKDYLQQADEAITNLLNEKAEEFQESIQPLQQALQTIQYAEQVQAAQNPMNVMPPAGTVNVLPQTQAPQGPAPQGVDPASGQVDPAMLQQLMGQGGMDPAMLAQMMGGAPQGDPSGVPPAAAQQGALPPEVAMQMQARRRTASATSQLIEELKNCDPNDVKCYELEDTLHHLAEQGDPEAIAFLSGEEVDPAYWDGAQVHDVHGHDSLYEASRRTAGGSRYFNEEGEPMIGGAEARFEDFLDQMAAEEGAYDDEGFGPDEYFRDDDDAYASEDGDEGYDDDNPHVDDKEWMDFRASRQRSPKKAEAPQRGRTAKDSDCTCWEGYERVPGTKPCAPGSCRKKARRIAKDLGNCLALCGKPAEGELNLRVLGPTPFCRDCAKRYLEVKKRHQGEGQSPGQKREAGVLDAWQEWLQSRAQKGQLGTGGDKDLYDFANDYGIGQRGIEKLRRYLFGSHKEAWMGWGPIQAARQHDVDGWEWDKRLSAYVATDVPESFMCKCGAKLSVPGYHNCKCGKIWNSYVIGTGGENRQAAVEKFLCREVPVRDNVIVAGKKMASEEAPQASSTARYVLLPHWDADEAHRILMQHAHDMGCHTALQVTPELMEEAHQGGFTLHDHVGDAPTDGYMVSLDKHSEESIPIADLTPQMIEAFVGKHADNLGQKGNYLGGWLDGGRFYLDVSSHIPDLNRATGAAVRNKQLGIYDLGKGRTVNTDEAGWLTGHPGVVGKNRRGTAHPAQGRPDSGRQHSAQGRRATAAGRRVAGSEECPACGKHIRSYDLSGVADHKGQRWCHCCLPEGIKKQMDREKKAAKGGDLTDEALAVMRGEAQPSKELLDLVDWLSRSRDEEEVLIRSVQDDYDPPEWGTTNRPIFSSRAENDEEDFASDAFPSDHHPDTGNKLKSTPDDWHRRDKNQRWTGKG